MRLCIHKRNSVCSRAHTCQGLSNGTASASCPARACWWEVPDRLHVLMHCKALHW